MPMLTINNLHSAYQGQVVLQGVDLSLAEGDILALLGPSGCGKTTLLRAIAGLQPTSHGQISIANTLCNDDGVLVPSEQRHVGMIFQDYALFPHLTVAQNILFGVSEKNPDLRAQRLQEMLALVRLQGLAERFPHQLSGGQQQRVSIARALAYRPKLLLLDEPFSNIDAQVRGQLICEIRQILKQLNISAIFVTHSKDEAFAFADQLALFKAGKIVQCGRPETLYELPNDRYVAEFLGSVNYLPASIYDNYQVDTPIGRLSSRTALNKPISYAGELLLRPQQFELLGDDNSDAVISERRFLGNHCHYVVDILQYRLQVHSEQTQWQLGQRVKLQMKAHSLVVF